LYIRNSMKHGFLKLGILLIAFCVLGMRTGFAADSLVWHGKDKTFDADVSQMELSTLLQKISVLTGWEIYLEPGTSFAASAKFKNLPRADALRLLLGKLNFEISPQSNSVPRLFVFRTGAGKATQLIRAEKKHLLLGKDKRILNHLIVTLKPGSRTDINVLAQQLGAKIIGKLDGQSSYLLEFPDEATANAARDQLAKVSDVASVDSNYSLEKPAPFAMASANGGSPFKLKASANGGDGDHVVIALIDTAVQKLSADMEGFLLPSISVAGESTPNGDAPTHGTMMAESILQGASSVLPAGQSATLKILPIDVYGNDESTTTFNVASGITTAVNSGDPTILSLSLGSEGDSPFLANLLDQIRQKNILIFAAAGNQPVTTPTYPAAYPSVIAVTSAQNSSGEVAPYANRGSFVDVILPGATIVQYNGASYYVNGTSVSTALASGTMAGLAERSGRSPVQLEQNFRSTAAFKR